MIQLRFAVTEESLETASPPELLPAGVILETVFEMPVFFIVNGINLLGFPDGSTIRLSMIGFAVAATKALERLEPGGCERIDIASAGDLFLQETNGKVKFWTTTLRPNVEASYDETVAAFRVFLDQVQRVIEARVPAIRKHPYWPRWFPASNSGQGGSHRC